MAELKEWIIVCRAWKQQLAFTALALHKAHQHHLLLEAEGKGQFLRAKKIWEKMGREKMKEMWGAIRRAMGKKWGRSVTRVERLVGQQWIEYTGKEDVVACVWEETSHFKLAESAPICNRYLFKWFGYLLDMATAQAVLEGTFIPPPDKDNTTCLLLKEIWRIGRRLTHSNIYVTTTTEDF